MPAWTNGRSREMRPARDESSNLSAGAMVRVSKT